MGSQLEPQLDQDTLAHHLRRVKADLERTRFYMRLYRGGAVACPVVGLVLTILAFIADLKLGFFILAMSLLICVALILIFNEDHEKRRAVEDAQNAEINRLERFDRELTQGTDTSAAYRRYRYDRYLVDLQNDVQDLKKQARKYGIYSTISQVLIIVGSASASVSAVLADKSFFRGLATLTTLTVAAVSGLTLAFKPKEKSENLEYTAEEIEREMSLFDLRIGPYSAEEDRLKRSSMFVERVEDLKSAMTHKQRELRQIGGVHHTQPSKVRLDQDAPPPLLDTGNLG